MPHRRTRRSADDAGFTLIELLVVMIIIGILAAIAIPVFLSQRAKARDAATQSDVSRLGKEIAAYYVDGTGGLTVTLASSTITVTDTAATPKTIATLGTSSGTALQATAFKATAGSEPTTWCVALTNANGSQKDYSFSATGGLQKGACP